MKNVECGSVISISVSLQVPCCYKYSLNVLHRKMNSLLILLCARGYSEQLCEVLYFHHCPGGKYLPRCEVTAPPPFHDLKNDKFLT